MEKEHVLNEHHTSSLRHSGRHSIEHTRRHEGVVISGSGTPRCCCGGDDEEPEQDGVPAKIGGEYDSQDTAGAQHENVAGLRVVHDVCCRVPLSVNEEGSAYLSGATGPFGGGENKIKKRKEKKSSTHSA